ncbi:hypothetical protein [Arthrobacter sp. 35W]|uniref:hypothetical protein n=1 Tax=Arthrobacter sp. 35W TaxID=1132441 RepID=UPI0003FC232E|nr:hypothetical protein [Arthrobacter sp. 35W]
MELYGVFQWLFWILAFATGILTLSRTEVFSTGSTQRSKGHAGQQFFLWFMTAAFALSGFIAAVLAMRADMAR